MSLSQGSQSQASDVDSSYYGAPGHARISTIRCGLTVRRSSALCPRSQPLGPPGLGAEGAGGVNQFLGGELEAWIEHAADCSAGRGTTSKRGVRALYTATTSGGRLP